MGPHPARGNSDCSDISDSDNIREEVENKITHSKVNLAIPVSLTDTLEAWVQDKCQAHNQPRHTT